jgi:hypothetical protein
MQSDWLVFFIGSAEDYFDILNATYQSVKGADSSAYVVQGGMAGVFVDHAEFWDDVLDLGGSNYFDIANIHSINSDSVAINAPEFKQYLDQHGVDMPFWVTEVEIGSMESEKDGEREEDTTDLLITNVVQAFESGADKIFLPGIMNPSTFKDEKPGLEDSYYATKVLVSKLNYFNSVEKLNDGQYKFTSDDDVVYVLWGENNIPQEITGQVKITNSSEEETTLNAEDLSLTDSPIFVEII